MLPYENRKTNVFRRFSKTRYLGAGSWSLNCAVRKYRFELPTTERLTSLYRRNHEEHDVATRQFDDGDDGRSRGTGNQKRGRCCFPVVVDDQKDVATGSGWRTEKGKGTRPGVHRRRRQTERSAETVAVQVRGQAEEIGLGVARRRGRGSSDDRPEDEGRTARPIKSAAVALATVVQIVSNFTR